ncbi:MAG: LytTR family transcriptional regulator [Rhodobacteraceae bacterium]|nr:MAG: LytTR family transcriptional regulator [Paracoccaceae bacterium]
MSEFWRIYLRALKIPALPVIWLVASAFGVIAGPFGSLEGMSFGGRLLYWPLVVGMAILIGTAIRIFVRRRFRLRVFWLEALVVASLAALVLAGPIFQITAWLANDPELPDLGVLHMLGYIFGLSMANSVLRRRMAPLHGRSRRKAVERVIPARPPEPDPAPRLLDRVEPALRAPLIRLSVCDHYVDVVTEAGQASLLMRLADAIAETEGTAGMQVHRSHWVAQTGVRAIRRARGKTFLVMADGEEVPVSRTYQAQVEAENFPASDESIAAQ